jgi:diadenosine tetraphosphate (Ap4A) HIT family hydrolase
VVGEVSSPLSESCRFCYPPEPWRIIFSSLHFRVIMGLGPLAEGYALVISNEHHSCCAALPGEQFDEFGEVISMVRSAQVGLYGSSLAFEHGRSGACLPPGHGEDFCYHAHLHLTPSGVDLATAVADDHALEYLPDWPAVMRRFEEDYDPYILVQDGDGYCYASTPEKLVPRYLRTKLAAMLGTPWLSDWVAFPSYPVIRRGLDRMRLEIQAPCSTTS